MLIPLTFTRISLATHIDMDPTYTIEYFGQFIQQSVFDNDDTTPNVLFANPESMYDINVSVRGPDRIEIHTTNSAANSGTCKAMLQFERIDNNMRLGKRI